MDSERYIGNMSQYRIFYRIGRPTPCGRYLEQVILTRECDLLINLALHQLVAYSHLYGDPHLKDTFWV